jgi:hypothetical protein
LSLWESVKQFASPTIKQEKLWGGKVCILTLKIVMKMKLPKKEKN